MKGAALAGAAGALLSGPPFTYLRTYSTSTVLSTKRAGIGLAHITSVCTRQCFRLVIDCYCGLLHKHLPPCRRAICFDTRGLADADGHALFHLQTKEVGIRPAVLDIPCTVLDKSGGQLNTVSVPHRSGCAQQHTPGSHPASLSTESLRCIHTPGMLASPYSL